jgi:hypothetical protein
MQPVPLSVPLTSERPSTLTIVTHSAVFKTGAFNRSATPPGRGPRTVAARKHRRILTIRAAQRPFTDRLAQDPCWANSGHNRTENAHAVPLAIPLSSPPNAGLTPGSKPIRVEPRRDPVVPPLALKLVFTTVKEAV